MSIPVSTLTGSNTINQMMYNVNTIKNLAANTSHTVSNTDFQTKANTNNTLLTGVVKVNSTQFHINATSTVDINPDATFGSNGAVRLPRGTTAQRTINELGSFRYNTDDGQFEGYGSVGWGAIGGGGVSSYKFLATGSSYTANSTDRLSVDTSGGIVTVTLPATPSSGDIVEFFDKEVSWATNNLTVARNGSTIEGSGTDLIADVSGSNFYCQYDGSTWQVFGVGGVDVTVGGDLTGTVSNAQIAAGAVTSVEIATGTVSNAQIAAGAVTSVEIDGSVVANTYLQSQGYATTGKAIAMAIVFG